MVQDGVLMCPHCGGNYLHHTSVEIFSRKEDEPTGLLTHVRGIAGARGEVVSSEAPESASRSGRRGSVAIHFSCETCDAELVLVSAQHKGQTLFSFEAERVGGSSDA